jgi:ABC-2 type transport system permease protein
MNIINIALNEIKRDFRDIRTLVFMLAFPIVLMLVLGTALSNTFSDHIQVDDITVLYKNTSQGELSQALPTFFKAADKSGIHFKKASPSVDGKNEVKQNSYAGYVEIKQDGIELYLNEKNSIEGSILQGMLSSFVDKYNIASEVVKVAPEKVATVFSHQDDFIKESSLVPDREPSSMDYYAIVMTTMIALYGAMSASTLINGERVRKTADRLIASPVRKSEIFIGKVFGSIVINAACLALVILFSRFVFKAYWGSHPWMIAFVLLTEVLFAVSLGIGLSYITKSNAGPRMMVLLFVQLSSFFGGAYFKIENPQGIFKFITELSPLTWMNTALTKVIYANNLWSAAPAIAINIGGSILFLLIAVISLQRREGL